jgi:predicted transglutaminase-like cysteine proteinase
MSECPHGLFDVCCTNYERCTLGAPKKEWVGLTDDERDEIYNNNQAWVHAVEAKLKEKNT